MVAEDAQESRKAEIEAELRQLEKEEREANAAAKGDLQGILRRAQEAHNTTAKRLQAEVGQGDKGEQGDNEKGFSADQVDGSSPEAAAIMEQQELNEQVAKMDNHWEIARNLKLAEVFGQIDIDGSGSISLMELRRYLKAHGPAGQSVSSKMALIASASGSGGVGSDVSKDDFIALMSSIEMDEAEALLDITFDERPQGPEVDGGDDDAVGVEDGVDGNGGTVDETPMPADRSTFYTDENGMSALTRCYVDFNKGDKDDSGTIDVHELQAMLAGMVQGNNVPFSFVLERLCDMDSNDDGVVDFSEYVHYICDLDLPESEYMRLRFDSFPRDTASTVAAADIAASVRLWIGDDDKAESVIESGRLMLRERLTFADYVCFLDTAGLKRARIDHLEARGETIARLKKLDAAKKAKGNHRVHFDYTKKQATAPEMEGMQYMGDLYALFVLLDVENTESVFFHDILSNSGSFKIKGKSIPEGILHARMEAVGMTSSDMLTFKDFVRIMLDLNMPRLEWFKWSFEAFKPDSQHTIAKEDLIPTVPAALLEQAHSICGAAAGDRVSFQEYVALAHLKPGFKIQPGNAKALERQNEVDAEEEKRRLEEEKAALAAMAEREAAERAAAEEEAKIAAEREAAEKAAAEEEAKIAAAAAADEATEAIQPTANGEESEAEVEASPEAQTATGENAATKEIDEALPQSGSARGPEPTAPDAEGQDPRNEPSPVAPPDETKGSAEPQPAVDNQDNAGDAEGETEDATVQQQSAGETDAPASAGGDGNMTAEDGDTEDANEAEEEKATGDGSGGDVEGAAANSVEVQAGSEEQEGGGAQEGASPAVPTVVVGSLRFEMEFSDDFEEKHGESVKSSLAKSCGVDLTQVAISNIRPGSVVFDYAITCPPQPAAAEAASDTPQPLDINQIATKLNEAMAPGGAFATNLAEAGLKVEIENLRPCEVMAVAPSEDVTGSNDSVEPPAASDASNDAPAAGEDPKGVAEATKADEDNEPGNTSPAKELASEEEEGKDAATQDEVEVPTDDAAAGESAEAKASDTIDTQPEEDAPQSDEQQVQEGATESPSGEATAEPDNTATPPEDSASKSDGAGEAATAADEAVDVKPNAETIALAKELSQELNETAVTKILDQKIESSPPASAAADDGAVEPTEEAMNVGRELSDTIMESAITKAMEAGSEGEDNPPRNVPDNTAAEALARELSDLAVEGAVAKAVDQAQEEAQVVSGTDDSDKARVAEELGRELSDTVVESAVTRVMEAGTAGEDGLALSPPQDDGNDVVARELGRELSDQMVESAIAKAVDQPQQEMDAETEAGDSEIAKELGRELSDTVVESAVTKAVEATTAPQDDLVSEPPQREEDDAVARDLGRELSERLVESAVAKAADLASAAGIDDENQTPPDAGVDGNVGGSTIANDLGRELSNALIESAMEQALDKNAEPLLPADEDGAAANALSRELSDTMIETAVSNAIGVVVATDEGAANGSSTIAAELSRELSDRIADSAVTKALNTMAEQGSSTQQEPMPDDAVAETVGRELSQDFMESAVAKAVGMATEQPIETTTSAAAEIADRLGRELSQSLIVSALDRATTSESLAEGAGDEATATDLGRELSGTIVESAISKATELTANDPASGRGDEAAIDAPADATAAEAARSLARELSESAVDKAVGVAAADSTGAANAAGDNATSAAVPSQPQVVGCLRLEMEYSDDFEEKHGNTVKETLAGAAHVEPDRVSLSNIRPGSVIFDYAIRCDDGDGEASAANVASSVNAAVSPEGSFTKQLADRGLSVKVENLQPCKVDIPTAPTSAAKATAFEAAMRLADEALTNAAKREAASDKMAKEALGHDLTGSGVDVEKATLSASTAMPGPEISVYHPEKAEAAMKEAEEAAQVAELEAALRAADIAAEAAEREEMALQAAKEAEAAAAKEAAEKAAQEAAAAAEKEAAEQQAEKEAAEQQAAREAAEQQAAREAAEQQAAREAAEQQAAREAAEQQAAREAAEQQAAREAAEQQAAREAAEQQAAREAADAAAKLAAAKAAQQAINAAAEKVASQTLQAAVQGAAQTVVRQAALQAAVQAVAKKLASQTLRAAVETAHEKVERAAAEKSAKDAADVAAKEAAAAEAQREAEEAEARETRAKEETEITEQARAEKVGDTASSVEDKPKTDAPDTAGEVADESAAREEAERAARQMLEKKLAAQRHYSAVLDKSESSVTAESFRLRPSVYRQYSIMYILLHGDDHTRAGISSVDLETRLGIPPSKAKALFEQIDLDGNGVLDFHEFITFLLRTDSTAELTDAQIQAATSSGEATIVEDDGWVPSGGEENRYKLMFEVMDADASKTVDMEEVTRAFPEHAEDMASFIDTVTHSDGSRPLIFDEFALLMHKYENIVDKGMLAKAAEYDGLADGSSYDDVGNKHAGVLKRAMGLSPMAVVFDVTKAIQALDVLIHQYGTEMASDDDFALHAVLQRQKVVHKQKKISNAHMSSILATWPASILARLDSAGPPPEVTAAGDDDAESDAGGGDAVDDTPYRQAFELLDTDGSGSLSAEELNAALQQMLVKGLSMDQLSALFDLVGSIEGKEEIDYDYFYKIVHESGDVSIFDRLDTPSVEIEEDADALRYEEEKRRAKEEEARKAQAREEKERKRREHAERERVKAEREKARLEAEERARKEEERRREEERLAEEQRAEEERLQREEEERAYREELRRKREEELIRMREEEKRMKREAEERKRREEEEKERAIQAEKERRAREIEEEKRRLEAIESEWQLRRDMAEKYTDHDIDWHHNARIGVAHVSSGAPGGQNDGHGHGELADTEGNDGSQSHRDRQEKKRIAHRRREARASFLRKSKSKEGKGGGAGGGGGGNGGSGGNGGGLGRNGNGRDGGLNPIVGFADEWSSNVVASEMVAVQQKNLEQAYAAGARDMLRQVSNKALQGNDKTTVSEHPSLSTANSMSPEEYLAYGKLAMESSGSGFTLGDALDELNPVFQQPASVSQEPNGSKPVFAYDTHDSNAHQTATERTARSSSSMSMDLANDMVESLVNRRRSISRSRDQRLSRELDR